MEKTKQLIVGLLIVSAVCLAQSPRPTRELMTLLQEAQYQEQTAGDLDKAIELYGQVMTEAAQVERLAARAAFQLAVCYQKKGDTAKAAEYYQKVVNEFPSQKTLAERAAKELEAIAPDTTELIRHIIVQDSFEKGNGAPDGWQKGAFIDGVEYIWDKHVASDGKASLGFRKTAERYFPIAQWTRRIEYVGDTGQIEFSAKVRAQQAYKAVLDVLFLDDNDEWIKHQWAAYIGAKNPGDPPADHDWKKYAGTVDIPEKTKTIVIGLQMYGPGTVWFDEVEVALIQIASPEYTAEAYRQKLKQPITVNVAQSPDGDRLTVQYAAIAIAEEAGVPYQWDKSAQLAHPQRTRYIAPLRIAGKPAAQALADVLGPVELSFGIDENGVYLYSDEKLKAVVEKAVLTISTCAETDPRVKTSLDSLKGLPDEAVTAAVSAYLDEASPTVRRSAIYILWKGEFSDISAAEQGLLELCGHPENFTRGMAAITLGGSKVSDAYDAIARMTLHDEDAYARRCAAYALGLLGDSKALPVLEQALQDKEDLVKQNAQAAITMLTKLTELDSVAAKPSKPDKLRAEDLIAEGWALWQARKLAEAEKMFEEAAAADPTSDGAYQGLGWAQLNQGKRANAKLSFERCVSLNPKNSAALNGLGWIAHGQDNKDEAIGWWEKAVAAQPGATASLSGLTQVYMERRDYQNAIRYYQMWLRAEPNNQDAKDGLEKARKSLAEMEQ